jgi:ribonuclease-3
VTTTNLENLEIILGYTFKNKDLLVQALTHISYANDNKVESYERLEFLGDAIIELVVSDYIFRNFGIDAGSLTKLRSALVSTEYLCCVAKDMELDQLCRKSKSLSMLSKKNIADLFESLVGAIYIDSGLDEAKKIIEKFVIIDDVNVRFVIKNSIDYKSKLQEYMQANNIRFEYKLKGSTGLDHAREFEVELVVDGSVVATSKGGSIQLAEERCAHEYISKL